MIISSSAATFKGVRSLAGPTLTRNTIRRSYYQNVGNDEVNQAGLNDLILSILQANPSTRDAQGYLDKFSKPPALGKAGGPSPSRPIIQPKMKNPLNPPADVLAAVPIPQTQVDAPHISQQAALELLNPIPRRTALVKFQGPFTNRQLESICRGMVYLEKLGLVSVIVVERDDWTSGQDGERADVKEDVMRITTALESQGAKARPILEPLVRLGPLPNSQDELLHEPRRSLLVSDQHSEEVKNVDVPPSEVQAHTWLQDLVPIRSALRAGEIPVLAPLALDSFSRMVRVDANDVVAALVKGMVEVGKTVQPPAKASEDEKQEPSSIPQQDDVDLTPMRLMIINREGGIPSYARHGLPHLLINLSSEYSHIQQTYDSSWKMSHPTSLATLTLSRTCLSYMPPSSSAVVVSHRSPRSLIANLITNKPAQSSSLPAYLLTNGSRKVTTHTPTLIRKGLSMRVIQRENMHDIDKDKMTHLLEKSFKRTLVADTFYNRLEKVLDYVIIAGDYAGACIVTEEPIPSTTDRSITYLDKFAVHPDHQGDGTVDFLWVALHDESFGLGLAHALNPNEGGKMGVGTGRDLVWRSRTNNPANRWYYERASGHLRMGEWTMFWCDAEDRLRMREEELIAEGFEGAKARLGYRGKGIEGLSFVERGEGGRLDEWAEVVKSIPGSWVPIVKKS